MRPVTFIASLTLLGMMPAMVIAQTSGTGIGTSGYNRSSNYNSATSTQPAGNSITSPNTNTPGTANIHNSPVGSGTNATPGMSSGMNSGMNGSSMGGTSSGSAGH